MIGIRADANEVVATGHIMRCMTIAGQLKKMDEEVIFFLADDYGISMLEERNLAYVVMHTDWEKPTEELPILCREIEKRNIHTMLFDSYRITKEYFNNLRTKLSDRIRLAYIDDLFEDIYPVDVLINYNAYHARFPYEKSYMDAYHSDKEHYPVKTKLCLGPAYVPLREEFGKDSVENGCDNSVLLSCGGGDSLQSMYGILEKAMRDERFLNVVFHVIVGRYHQKKELLEKIAEEHKNIVLHHDIRNMAEIMEENRIAVSAAGTMLYELCAMERPTVFFITADNQRYDSDFFAKDERMLFAGDIRADREACINHVLDGMHELLGNCEKCAQMKEKLRCVTDGNGAKRIAEALLEEI